MRTQSHRPETEHRCILHGRKAKEILREISRLWGGSKARPGRAGEEGHGIERGRDRRAKGSSSGGGGKGVGRHRQQGAICRGGKAVATSKSGWEACRRRPATKAWEHQCAYEASVIVAVETWAGGRRQQQAAEQKLGEDSGVDDCQRCVALHARVEAQAKLSRRG